MEFFENNDVKQYECKDFTGDFTGYSTGYFTKDSTDQLFQCCLAGATYGDSKLKSRLGCAYYHGRLGLAVNCEKAVYWFTQAAENEYEEALYYLGRCYCEGAGVMKDNEKASYWLKKAASFYPEAGELLDLIEDKV